jgi:hypothetical protein
MMQTGLAKRLGWPQTTISDIEIGDKRVSAIEPIQLGEALGFDPMKALGGIAKNPRLIGVRVFEVVD